MRICMYTETALPKIGGHEYAVDALARQFLALGHEPVVFAPRPRKLSIRGESYPYELVRHPRFYSTQYFVAWYRRFLVGQYRRKPFDLLHCHGVYPPSYLASLTRAQIPVPLVVISQGGDVYEHNVRLRKPTIVERSCQGLRAADALVAISQFTREGFTRLCPEVAGRIVDIPNGVHVSNYSADVPPPADPAQGLRPGSYAIFVGRREQAQEAVDVLLRALARLPATGGVELAIVGDGEERPVLESLSAELGLTQRVRFFGMITGPAKTYLLQNARFGVVPSRNWESFRTWSWCRRLRIRDCP